MTMEIKSERNQTKPCRRSLTQLLEQGSVFFFSEKESDECTMESLMHSSEMKRTISMKMKIVYCRRKLHSGAVKNETRSHKNASEYICSDINTLKRA